MPAAHVKRASSWAPSAHGGVRAKPPAGVITAPAVVVTAIDSCWLAEGSCISRPSREQALNMVTQVSAKIARKCRGRITLDYDY